MQNQILLDIIMHIRDLFSMLLGQNPFLSLSTPIDEDKT